MTPAQIRTVRASFARIEPALPQLGKRFYERLFGLAPELRSLFEVDMAVQEARFMKVVGELVNLHLRSLLSLPAVGGRASIPALAQLGRSHAAMGVRPAHFGAMRLALAGVLREDLREDFTREVEEAWMAAFDVLAHAMEDGMAGAPAGQDRFLDRLSDEDDGAAPARAPNQAAALEQFFQ
jgi:hemoglobin-like flavoprotein